MNVALDVGSREMRALRFRQDGSLSARRSSSQFCVLEDAEPLRSLFDRIETTYARCDGQILIYGADAEPFSALFRTPLLDLFPDGRLPDDDPPVRQLTAMLIESLIGRSSSNDAVCVLTMPGEPTTEESVDRGTAGFLSRLVKLQGYRPLILSAPHAVVLANLAEETFTGIGLSCGAGACQASLVHRGMELACCSVPYAGNWIDGRMARGRKDYVWDAFGYKHLNTAVIRMRKEAFCNRPDSTDGSPASESGAFSEDDRQKLFDLHRGMLEAVFREAASVFAPLVERWNLPRRLSLVVAGGSARIPRFEELVSAVLRTIRMPVTIQRTLIATDSDFTVARGGLIRAELETGDAESAAA